MLNSNVENKLVEKVSVPIHSRMIGSKSWVNRYYTIQFSIKSSKSKAPNRQIQKVNPTLARYSFPHKKCHIKWLTLVRFFIIIRRFIFLLNGMSIGINFRQKVVYDLYHQNNPTILPYNFPLFLLGPINVFPLYIAWQFSFFLYSGPVSWDCRIRQLHLCRGLRLLQWVSWVWH